MDIVYGEMKKKKYMPNFRYIADSFFRFATILHPYIYIYIYIYIQNFTHMHILKMFFVVLFLCIYIYII